MFSKRELLRLFWPILVEQTLATTIGVVNTMMVSGVGEAAISAVGLVDSLNNLIMNVFIALATGATVVVAQNVGAGNVKAASETTNQAFSACVMLAAVCSLFMVCLGRPLIAALFPGTEALVTANAQTYLYYSAGSYPFLAAFSAAAGILRAGRNTRGPMIASVVSNLVNVGVGALLIFGLRLGVAGAGVALVCARMSGALLLVWMLRSNVKDVRLTRFTLRFRREILVPVLKIGIPAGIDSLIFNGGKLLVQTFVAALGTTAIAANSIACSLNSFVMIPGNAICTATATVIGNAVGTGEREEVRRQMFRLTGYSMVLLTGMVLLFAPFVTPFLGLYSPTPEALTLARNVTYLTLVCSPVLWPPAFISHAALRSAGDAVYVTCVSVGSMWACRVFCAWLLGNLLGWGLIGIWVAWCGDWLVRGVFVLGRILRRGYERHMPHLVRESA